MTERNIAATRPKQHRFHWTGYCQRCGAHKDVALYEDLRCLTTEQSKIVVAISHVRSEKLIDQELARQNTVGEPAQL